MQSIPKALTIAGTDPTGGAGIQADLKTFQEVKTYGMSVITSVVAQNTTGVQDVHHVPNTMIQQQLKSVLSDIVPLAFKTGMLANTSIMESVLEFISQLEVPYVMDPVMIASSGDPLISQDSREFLSKKLVPLTTVVTPNIKEAEVLTDSTIETTEDMQHAAKQIVHDLKAKAALVKGGHMKGEAVDFLYDGESINSFTAERIDSDNTHGTGCTYSAAITAYLSQGDSLHEAVKKAKKFVTGAIRHSLPLGEGTGPTNHWAERVEMGEQYET